MPYQCLTRMLRGSIRVAITIALAAMPLVAASRAHGSACSWEPDNAAKIAAAIERTRELCPCPSFSSRASYRSCLRRVVSEAVARGEIPRACRGDVLRLGTGTVCGAKPGTVTCCRTRASGRESCSVGTAERCMATRGGIAGRIGVTDGCYDACAPAPTSTPAGPTPSPGAPSTVTPATPTPTPNGIGPRCVCTCAPPPSPPPYGPYGCPSFHECAVMTFVPTGAADCDALDTPQRSCTYHSNAPLFYPNGPLHDVCTF